MSKVKTISQEYLKEVLHYNPETGAFTWLKTLGSKGVAGNPAGYYNLGYLTIGINGKGYRAHRLAWLYVYGVWPNDQIDHINHDRADNRIENLREVTNRENNLNQSLRSDNKSGVAGVHWFKRDEKWRSEITIHGKPKHLGLFADKFEAICAKKSAENKYNFHRNHGSK